jgi:hypothetical protein
LNGIHARAEMSMIHTKDVDFTALVPTCFVRFTSEPLVTVGCQLYSHGGEVRRVLLQDDLTGQTYEVDLMLCDPKFCHNCGATADACPPISFNDSARQDIEHPRGYRANQRWSCSTQSIGKDTEKVLAVDRYPSANRCSRSGRTTGR